MDEKIIEKIGNYAQEDLQFISEEVFFFGEIYDDYGIEESDDYPKACCPVCGNLIKLKKRPKPRTGQDICCPQCGKDGTLFDFRDENLPLENHNPIPLAYIENLNYGYALHLFAVGLDYSNRDYSDYTTLSHYPDMQIKEVGREYWKEGKIEYYENLSDDPFIDEFVPCERLDDTDYTIVNYDYEKTDNPIIDSRYIADILCELGTYKDGMNFIEFLKQKLSYKTFRTLKKYGFDTLTEAYLYKYASFPHSDKISEILGVDYNQIIASVDTKTFTAENLIDARKLTELNLKITKKNLKIISKLNTEMLNCENARKTFKYLRNLTNKLKSSNAISDYNDYISDCVKLNLDVTANEIRYPSKFMEMHTRYAMLLEEEQNEQKIESFTQTTKRFENIDFFQNDNLMIRIAHSPSELKTEGKILNHCVAGYVDRVCNRNCLIFFVRKVSEPDIPFYTLEYDPIKNKLVQCRGYRIAIIQKIRKSKIR